MVEHSRRGIFVEPIQEAECSLADGVLAAIRRIDKFALLVVDEVQTGISAPECGWPQQVRADVVTLAKGHGGIPHQYHCGREYA